MVDLRATNAKLRDRSERIIVEVTGVDRDEAKRLLAAAGDSVKLAIVMHALRADRAAAAAALEKGGGIVRRVIPGPPPPVR
jgi:N-acetylmuramic acid 6-phosphate etherase